MITLNVNEKPGTTIGAQCPCPSYNDLGPLRVDRRFRSRESAREFEDSKVTARRRARVRWWPISAAAALSKDSCRDQEKGRFEMTSSGCAVAARLSRRRGRDPRRFAVRLRAVLDAAKCETYSPPTAPFAPNAFLQHRPHWQGDISDAHDHPPETGRRQECKCSSRVGFLNEFQKICTVSVLWNCACKSQSIG